MKPTLRLLFGLLLAPLAGWAADAPANPATSVPTGAAAPATTASASKFTAATPVKGFETTGLDLYRSREETLQRAANNDMATYTKNLQATCEQFFANASLSENLAIVAAIKPGPESRIWLISTRSATLDDRLAPLRDELAAIPPPSVNGGPVAFCLYGRVNGGFGKELKGANYPPLPQAWKDVLAQSQNSAPVPFDALVLAAWNPPSVNWALIVSMVAIVLSAVCAVLAFMRRHH